MSRPDLAAALDLSPHPEGGWYRRTWTSPVSVETAHGTRPSATAILYLLDAPGRWHRVRSAELWCRHSGEAELVLGGDGDAPGAETVLRLGAPAPASDTPDRSAPASGGPGISAGPGAPALPQWEVPADVWQRAHPLGDEPVLVTCVVSPGFAFEDFELR
ncbi:cupin domain-containing protein [Pseudonocardia parietis]|uniref:Cupin superfamily sugar epimerase n=1 Tax=Pseudonocardia parietis TaxID=570936 RepID=A0ABS4W2I6_9PSEU|nr:cupin domain-containing protein [Pseudonocardia parietis]MBP2370323.1 putative cupin superfamily sugar epimerase [Pseudonocardia parietis]